MTTIGGALWRVVAGFSVVEACSLYQGAFGARVDPGVVAPRRASRCARSVVVVVVVVVVPDLVVHWHGRSKSAAAAGWDRVAECVDRSAAPFILRQVRNMYLRGVLDVTRSPGR